MTSISFGSASVPGSVERAEDRVAAGEHTWIVLGGTQNEHEGVNEADLAARWAEALVSSPDPPTDAEVLEALDRMDEAVYAWRTSGPIFWGAGLDFVSAVLGPTAVRITHVGATAAYGLSLPDHPSAPVAERLTQSHTYGDPASGVVIASVGAYPIQHIDIATLHRRRPMRVVLVSAGALAGLETPLGYLAGVRSPKECAERICAEARTRSGGLHHATAIVVDVDHDGAGPYR